jgi:hypothetical protein
MSIKNSSSIIGILIREIPACRAVCQPNASQRVPAFINASAKNPVNIKLFMHLFSILSDDR